MSLFEEPSATLAAAYPEAPAALRHMLVGHPLFTLDALQALGERMRPEHVRCCRGDVPVGLGKGVAPDLGRTLADTLARIDRPGSWIVFRYADRDPAYGALMDAVLAEIEGVVRPRTGAMVQREAFIFVSSPGAVTPAHFDPEHNILLQLAGTKTVHVLAAADERVMPASVHEIFHHQGHNGLPWREEFAALAEPFTIAPGDGVYMPVKAPHWVVNGDAPSISFSVTWRSPWSQREGEAQGFNRLARRFGLDPAPTRRYPGDNRLKSLAYRCVRKAGRVMRVGPST